MTPEVEQELSELGIGEEITVEEDGEHVTYRRVARPEEILPCSGHIFEQVGENEYQCKKCGNGRIGVKPS